MTSTDLFFDLGTKMACHRLRVTPEDLQYSQALVDRVRYDEKGEHHKRAAAMGALAYALAGRQTSFGHALCVKLATAPVWHQSFVQFMEPVYEAFAKHGIEKHAAIGALASKALPYVQNSLTTAMLLASLTGAGAGALNWKLNRDVTDQADDVAAMKAKVREYQRVADEIDNGLMMHGFQPS